MDLDQLISEFDSAAGLEHASAADGIWKYSADGHVFGVTADEKEERIFLFGEIPDPPPDRQEAFRKAALEANFFMRGTGGAVFSLNPETGAYTLVQSERLDRLDPKSFFSLVEKFVNTLATWKGIADAAQETVGAPAPAPRSDEQSDSFTSLPIGGFMRA